MQYNNYPEAKMAASDVMPELKNVFDRLLETNKYRDELLGSIMGGIGRIKRFPLQESAAKEQSIPRQDDFVSALDEQVSIMVNHNRTLADILQHLSSII